MEFQDRVVMLTGAGGRLGRPCALAFAREGARLLLTDLAADRLEETARQARAAGARVVAVAADVSRPDDVGRLLAEGAGPLGPVDVLVGFHGYVPTTHVRDVSVEEWDRTFAVNVRGTMLCCQAVARQLIERGARGSLVNVSSGASTSARAGGAHYCGSKAAVNMLTEVLAIELGPHGIRVNAVAPGWVATDMTREALAAPGAAADLAKIPLGRAGRPEEIAGPIAFLASDLASYVYGEVLAVNGGAVMSV
jgi:NAD(P)-dependent dehydrogenase (short-subunit alcohol dehydrogenase family)